jgi:hypothetical protein
MNKCTIMHFVGPLILIGSLIMFANVAFVAEVLIR